MTTKNREKANEELLKLNSELLFALYIRLDIENLPYNEAREIALEYIAKKKGWTK